MPLRQKRWFKRLKTFQITAASGVPVVIALSAPTWVAAVLGGLVAVGEGLQGLNQYQQNWFNYRSTCEALKHEKYLYLAKAGPCSDETRNTRSGPLHRRSRLIASLKRADPGWNHGLCLSRRQS